MEKLINEYWKKRLEGVKISLEKNNFEAYVVENRDEARELVMRELLPASKAKSVSWGGSMTFLATGLYDALKNTPGLEIVDTYDKTLVGWEAIERRRQSLLVDLYFTSANAITEDGMLVNLDGMGNRVAALAFGPKRVVVLAGRNKVVSELDDAMNRIKDYAAPINSMRLERKTPCAKTGYCEDCNSPERICNVWAIHEKSFPKGRIKVVLINEDLGF